MPKVSVKRINYKGSSIYAFLQKLFDKTIGKTKLYQRHVLNIAYYRQCQKNLISDIRKRNHANVVFFAANLPMWRYQGVYNQLKNDERFTVTVIIAPFENYTKEERDLELNKLVSYFSEQGVKYILLSSLPPNVGICGLNPDIIFYTQPYKMYGPNVRYLDFKEKLIAYIPYSFQNEYLSWVYNQPFHNIAWRLYYPTKSHKQTARSLAAVRDDNVCVSGEPNYDNYITSNNNPWKCDDNKKKIIYSPHFQISPNAKFYRPSFLWTFDVMLEIADMFRDDIHIAFKPHPRLFTALCRHPNWGEERAKSYYERWTKIANAQVETGEYVDLFMHSDALIHDCGSFTGEYLYTHKPCLFLTREDDTLYNALCPFGKQCIDNHYIGHNKEEILLFIKDVVIKGQDPKAKQRKDFYDNYLLPPNGKTTAENVYDDMVKSLFGNKNGR